MVHGSLITTIKKKKVRVRRDPDGSIGSVASAGVCGVGILAQGVHQSGRQAALIGCETKVLASCHIIEFVILVIDNGEPINRGIAEPAYRVVQAVNMDRVLAAQTASARLLRG